MIRPTSRLAAAIVPLALAACSSLGRDELPKKSPPLADMEEPVALHAEPKDEAARRALPLGSFTGLTVADARRSLDEDGAVPLGVRVSRVVENSPGDAAGVEEDDLLLSVETPGAAARELHWPSEWRRAETEAQPGTSMRVVVDRAGDERTVEIRTVARVRAGERIAADRFREEQKVGVVLRTATEVEARAAGLGAGGGAVVVGLAAGSPWRARGVAERDAGGPEQTSDVRFEDLIASVDDRPVAHPQQVLDAIRAAKGDATLRLGIVRDGVASSVEVPVSRREKQVRRASIPFVYSYESERGMSETSILMGLFRSRSTEAAWEWRLFWLLDVSGGDADRLVEVTE